MHSHLELVFSWTARATQEPCSVSGGSSGTFYMDDAYNMFYNPAYVTDAKNWAIIEKSNATGGGYYNNATTPTNGSGTTAQGGAVFWNR